MGDFRMPSLGTDMVAGTLTEWYKRPGDAVRRGDLIAAVDTDKGSIDVEAFEDGVVERLVVAEGEKVPVGTLLAIIRTPEGAAAVAPPPPAAVPTAAKAEVQVAVHAMPPEAAAPPSGAGGTSEEARRRVSPLARRRAAELGVDLARVHGTGPGGAVRVSDVDAAAAPGDRPARMRRAIAAAMTRSKREIPHFYLASTMDVGAATAWLERWNAARPPAERLLIAALLLKATALALQAFPEFNARWEDDGLRPMPSVHLGVATSLREGGLVVPALHDAPSLPLPELMAAMRDLVQRARAGALRSSDLADGTVTVTSLGERGADLVFGVIYPPQTAIIGFGSVVQRPWVTASGDVRARPVVTVTLAADHRAADGHRGAAFLERIDRLLQAPEAL